MITLSELLASAWVQRTGWTLVHSLWQLAVVASATVPVLVLLRNRSPQMRYGIACAAMGLMGLGPVATWCLVPDAAAAPSPVASPIRTLLVPDSAVPGLAADDASVRPVAPHAGPPATAFGPPTLPLTDPSPGLEAKPAPFWAAWSAWLPYGVLAWMLGVLLLAVRNVGGWATAQRLCSAGTSPIDGEVVGRLAGLIERAGLARPVRVLASTVVDMPMVVGSLRPLVLIPLSVLTGLPPLQLDAVIAHELAHIRRHDYLVNLLQTVVETLLFYHPAMWWISRRVRIERELCCDDMAVAVCGNKLAYAEALTAVERQRGRPALAMTAARGGALHRVRRVLGLGVQESIPWRPSLVGSLAALATVALLITCLTYAAELRPKPAATPIEADEPVAPDRDATVDGLLEFDKRIPLNLVSGAGDEEEIVRLAWVVFRKDDDELQADIRTVLLSYPKGRWRVTVTLPPELEPAKQKPLATANTVFENSGIVLGVPLRREGDLQLSLGPWEQARRAKRFRVHLSRAPSEAEVTGRLASGTTEELAGGRCSLQVTVKTTAKLDDDRVQFSLWRVATPADPLARDAATFGGGRVTWDDPPNATAWQPCYNVSTNLDRPYTVKELPAGRYRVTAGRDGTKQNRDPTPYGISGVIELTAQQPDGEVTVELVGGQRLTIRVVDGKTGKPMPREKILLRRQDGAPIGWGSSVGLGQWTDEEGARVYNGLEPGPYLLEVGRSGWWGGRYYPPQSVKRVDLTISGDRPKAITVTYDPPDLSGRSAGLQRTLEADKHTVRAAFFGHSDTDHEAEPMRVVSDPVETVVEDKTTESAWGEAAEGVSVRLKDVHRVWGRSDWPDVVVRLTVDARNDGQYRLHLPENGLTWQVEVDGRWYEHVPKRTHGDIVDVGHVSKLLDFQGGRKHENLTVEVAGGWRRIPAGKELAYARRRYGSGFAVVGKVEDQYGEVLHLTPGKHRLRVALACPSSRAGQNIEPLRVVSNAMQIDTTFRASFPAESAAVAEGLPDWALAVRKVFAGWELIACDEEPSLQVGTGRGSRLLLRHGRRELIQPAQQQAALALPGQLRDEDFRMVPSHIDIVVFPETAALPEDAKQQIPWQEVGQEWHVRPVDLGTGLGHRWFARTTIFWQEQLRENLKLQGGDDRLQLIAEGLAIRDQGDCTANSLVHPAAAKGDVMLPYLERMIEETPQEQCWRLVRPLGYCDSPKATQALLRFYQQEKTRDATAYGLISGKPREAAKPVYFDLLKRRQYLRQVAAACVEFQWNDAVPLLQEIVEKPATWQFRPAFEAMRRLQGKPVPANLAGAEQTLWRANADSLASEEVRRAKATLLGSADTEAAVVAAAYLANFSTKASHEKIAAVRGIGMELLRALPRDVTRPLLGRLAEHLDYEWDRQRFREILALLDTEAAPGNSEHVWPQ
ncbi:MAG: M56 family metallopeptidase [Pirellulales bacterium]|nr:M56 family metallopeptidase [Pirellulales bacterium]